MNLIRILNNFNQLEAIQLYRNAIHEVILDTYRELAFKKIISEGIHSFIAFDTYLSPLTSFPLNDVSRLLLYPQPFQRIYEDAYLLDAEAFRLYSTRAAAIYNHFGDILPELMKDNLFNYEVQLENFTRQMILYWNIASTRFDLICLKLDQFYEEGNIPHFYHIKSDGFGLNVIDLLNKKPLLTSSDIMDDILSKGLVPLVFKKTKQDNLIALMMRKPSSYLRPCLTFEDMGWKSKYILIDVILSELESKLADRIKKQENINN